MKQLVAILLMVITVLIIAPIKSYATDPKEIIWDSSTLSDNLPSVINPDEILLIKAGANISPILVQSITINGLVKCESGLLPAKLTNINLVIDSNITDQSIITNLDLSGSIEIKNGHVDILNSDIHSAQIGVLFGSNSSGTLENNYIHNNNIGVQINTLNNITVARNNFFQNIKFALENITTVQSDVIQNWWGCSTGPIPELLDDNPCQAISNVNFTPFLVGQVVKFLNPNDLIITEILSNPPIEPDQEWFEIFNNQDYPITLFDLRIGDNFYKEDDAKIISQISLPAKDFVVITGNKSKFIQLYSGFPIEKLFNMPEGKIGNGLSNSIDKITLIYPSLIDGQKINSIIDEVSYGSLDLDCSASIKENYSCSRFGDKYEWTSIPTPGAENQKSPPVVVQQVVILPVLPPTLISQIQSTENCPSIIKISQANNYYNCRVSIIAKVKRSYGSYFYIFDETGELKVYLQAAKKIKKPRLVANLQLKVTGTLDNYRTGIRLLPETSSDIELINQSLSTIKSNINQDPRASIEAQSIQPQVEVKSQAKLIPTISSILPVALPARAAVKGVSAVSDVPLPNHLPLKIVLFSAIIVLVALSSYNLGAKYGNAKS